MFSDRFFNSQSHIPHPSDRKSASVNNLFNPAISIQCVRPPVTDTRSHLVVQLQRPFCPGICLTVEKRARILAIGQPNPKSLPNSPSHCPARKGSLSTSYLTASADIGVCSDVDMPWFARNDIIAIIEPQSRASTPACAEALDNAT